MRCSAFPLSPRISIEINEIRRVGESSEMRDAKRSWPKFSLLTSAFLWLLAWVLITSFLPIQPRLIIRAENLETATCEYLAGFSPDGKALVTTVERDPILPGVIYHLWNTRTGEEMETIGN
jgi:hypothetical protein